MLWKPGPQLFIAEWLSKNNHYEGKHEKIPGIVLNINVIVVCTDIQECMMAKEIIYTKQDDNHLSALTPYVIHGSPLTMAEVKKELQ